MKNKVVIITGASSGIGKSLAESFADRNAIVVIAARNESKLLEVEESIKDRAAAVLSIKTDVSKEEECKALIQATVNKFAQIDILINNAGLSMRALIDQVDISVIRKLMDVNFWGMVYCTKYALPYLLDSSGSVVGVSSIAGYKGLPGRVGYSSSKFAMNGFLEVLRVENKKKGLHVLTAAPGFTTSNIRNTALSADGTGQGESPRDEKKMMTSEEVAERIVKAIKRRKRRLVLTTEGRLLVFINKSFPSLADKLVYNHFAKEPDSPMNQ